MSGGVMGVVNDGLTAHCVFFTSMDSILIEMGVGTLDALAVGRVELHMDEFIGD
jgi:hypothetical protein